MKYDDLSTGEKVIVYAPVVAGVSASIVLIFALKWFIKTIEIRGSNLVIMSSWFVNIFLFSFFIMFFPAYGYFLTWRWRKNIEGYNCEET